MAKLNELFGGRVDLGPAGHLDLFATDEVAEDTQVVTVHRGGKTFQEHRKKGKEEEHGTDTDTTHVPKSLKEKAVAVAKAVHLKAATWMTQLSPAAHRVGALLGAVLDTPDDFKKFAYNPTSTGVGVRSNDFVANNLQDAFGVGVSGHIVAAVAANVLSRAVMYAKRKLSSGVTEDVDAAVAEWAEFLRNVYMETLKELNLEGKIPSMEEIAEGLQALVSTRVRR